MKKPLIAGVLLALAWGIGFFPTFNEKMSQANQVMQIAGYRDNVTTMTYQEIKEQRDTVAAYNEKVRNCQKETPFAYAGEKAGTDDPDYQGILPGMEEIGYVDIPKIGVHLPFGRGTGSDMLEYMAGHMYGTSLPQESDGEPSHCVLTAHTGLASGRKLFTDLVKVEPGDTVELHFLGLKYIYGVDVINAVLPDEADALLNIEDGEDLVTLYTCTPYGINSHRLLVRGKLISEEPDSTATEGGAGASGNADHDRLAAVALAEYTGPIVLMVITGVILGRRNQKKKQET